MALTFGIANGHRERLPVGDQHAVVRLALAAGFAGPLGKDVVSRTWRKVQGHSDG